MKKGILKATSVAAVTALIVSCFPAVPVSAATSTVFPAAGGALAAGNGNSIQDIRANVARNAAMQSTITNHEKITKSDETEPVAKVETPSSKAVNEGTVIDGVCRDVDGIRKLGYPIYTKGKYMVTGKDRVMVDAVNTTVSISGVQVRPGDIILADESGAVCIPKEKAEEILQIAKHIEEVEQQILAEVEKGSSLKEARNKLGYHSLQTKVSK